MTLLSPAAAKARMFASVHNAPLVQTIGWRPFRGVADHRLQVAVDQRLAADEEQVADVVLHRDVHHVLRFLQGHAAAGPGIQLGTGETTETAVGVAEVGDGELEVARAAVAKDFSDEFEDALAWPLDRTGDGLSKGSIGDGR
jgi:hypothetical protein